MTWFVKTVDGSPVKPRIYSSGISQDKVVEKLVTAFKTGSEVVVLQSAPGTGKSLIALLTYYNLYGKSGKGVVVVPTRTLQLQYSEDYGGRRFIIGDGGGVLDIGFIWGRQNYRCRLAPTTCDEAPCVTQWKYLNIIEKMSRCPFYCKPLTRSQFERVRTYVKDVEEINTFTSITGEEIVLYTRSQGVCPYYQQFLNYVNCDVVVLNDWMWFYEKKLERIVNYDFIIIDEFDQIFMNHIPRITTRVDEFVQVLDQYLRQYRPRDLVEEDQLQELRSRFKQVVYLLKKFNTKDDFYQVLHDIVQLYYEYNELFEIAPDEVKSWFRKFEWLLDILTRHYNLYEVVRLGYRVHLVCVEPREYYRNVILRFDYPGKKMLLMSATPLERKLLKSMFGIDPDEIVVVEKKVPGKVYLGGTFGMVVSGKQFLEDGNYRKTYCEELWKTIQLARSEVSPRLGIITAYKYVDYLFKYYGIRLNIDEDGSMLQKLRNNEVDEVWTTRAYRGVDLPNVHGIIITKYPYPDLQDPFWQLLKNMRPELFKQFYEWVAEITLFQVICRALRDENCWVKIYSPDLKVKIKIQEFAKQDYIELVQQVK